ncbi:hypothetical protein NSPZN2_11338 [Nitrospira defluvii]|uniref:Uncharacterized protein n=1 Tax=Nitrospira defluvii TaxID=330214 RepID=A0ABM8QT50_9BACT|nr:hypothetical protein NSPZN2_11338 [Nitrospira defluvii]
MEEEGKAAGLRHEARQSLVTGYHDVALHAISLKPSASSHPPRTSLTLLRSRGDGGGNMSWIHGQMADRILRLFGDRTLCDREQSPIHHTMSYEDTVLHGHQSRWFYRN